MPLVLGNSSPEVCLQVGSAEGRASPFTWPKYCLNREPYLRCRIYQARPHRPKLSGSQYYSSFVSLDRLSFYISLRSLLRGHTHIAVLIRI
jgi:hypothetical protein